MSGKFTLVKLDLWNFATLPPGREKLISYTQPGQQRDPFDSTHAKLKVSLCPLKKASGRKKSGKKWDPFFYLFSSGFTANALSAITAAASKGSENERRTRSVYSAEIV